MVCILVLLLYDMYTHIYKYMNIIVQHHINISLNMY